jgi:hypothetical protein
LFYTKLSFYDVSIIFHREIYDYMYVL